jgi:hypothetical protein
MKYIKLFEEIISREKLNLSNYKYVFHWLNESRLFEQSYNIDNIETKPYILRRYGGKKLIMPPLPDEQFLLGEKSKQVCMTLDAKYISAGTSGENHICLVFPLDKLLTLEYEDLTDNSESEIRFKFIPNWNKIVEKIYIPNLLYSKGDGWEGFYYRAVSEWFPKTLIDKLEIKRSPRDISKELLKLQKMG